MRSYLHWRYSAEDPDAPSAPEPTSRPSREPSPAGSAVDQHPDDETIERSPDNADCPTVPDAEPESSDWDLEVECIDFYNPRETIIIPRTSRQLPAEALVRNGFLGATPERPSIAVSLDTLQLFYDIRRFKASYSVEAFTKMVCYKYVMPYRRRFRKAISDSFDVYLTLMEEIRSQIQTALGRNAPQWRVKWGCPPCSYKVREKPPVFERMVVMDGNNSLKRVAPAGNRKVGDTHKYKSDYYIPSEIVEKYANEVKSHQTQPHVEVPDGNDDDAASDDGSPGQEGDPTDGAPVSSCASNWKAAASDEKKKMWAIFEETGVFASACRHGFVLWLIDMIRSGELAKLPLATTDQIINEIREAIMLGFDIGCSFKTTLKNSSLGRAFDALGCKVCVNAFHGYSHSYPCQLKNHPNGIRGMGLEDLETLERMFSASNQLAIVTRYASAYRRVLLIHTFFRHWDEEKYANLGLFLYNNYVQALEIIQSKGPMVKESMEMLELTQADLETLENEERAYFDSLRDESPWDVHAMAYVEALMDLREACAELGIAEEAFLKAVPGNYQWVSPHSGPTHYQGDASATAKLETRRRTLEETVRRLTSQVVAMELRLNITTCWAPGDKEYEETKKYIATRNYQKALGRLQRLVIQRLFELHKLNLSQTAYRMRTHIAKSLQKRCKAIRTAVNQYNAAAAALTPTRPPLDWEKVSHFSFLEEFTLLQDTRNDIRTKKWAMPLVRETMRTFRRVTRAEEELENVNREARRLHTSIRDEDGLFTEVLQELERRRDPLHGAVADYCRRRRAVNAHVLAHLLRLYALDGFTGVPGPGTHSGAPREQCATVASSDQTPDQASAGSPMDIDSPSPEQVAFEGLASREVFAFERDDVEGTHEIDEDEDGDITNLVEHMSNIAVVM
ncbi:hypothetical protein L226DRAFT_457563 [Lentinus tigrinus ALCF2SS1-7]|uniref:uncharacterized protein n=1 Tax=Lentinus tigrinus ALCF2SS1-7 TaxID=1328758 RepID=UPI0011661F10|nr:hypothetical protein L226DRAFT_457563 [Lentinus tigrinus ALCF2SS1-7]